MTYISKKARILSPQWLDECDRGYVYQVNRKRSDGRLKRTSSCDDSRAWTDNECIKYQYFLELMSNAEFQERPFLGIMGRFIPMDTIFNLIHEKLFVCERESQNENGNVYDNDNGSFPSVDPEEILKIMNAAMDKLENIENIVHSVEDITSCKISKKSRRGSCVRSSSEGKYETDAEKQRNSIPDTENRSSLQRSQGCSRSSLAIRQKASEENLSEEYNRTLENIANLKGKLSDIHKYREELDAQLENTRREIFKNSSGSETTDPNGEGQTVYKLKKKIERLIVEKGEILAGMCQQLKHLNMLKANVNAKIKEKKRNLQCKTNASTIAFKGSDCEELQDECCCPCVSKANQETMPCDAPLGGYDTNGNNGCRENTSTETRSSDQRVSFDQQCQECGTSEKQSRNSTENDYETLYLNQTSDQYCEDSSVESDSAESAQYTDSCRTYSLNNINESIPDRKFRSETTMVEIEQTLRNYEQRLIDFQCLEIQVEELKKKALMANLFKTQWLKSCARGKLQMQVYREETKEKMGQLNAENSELKKAVRKMATIAEMGRREIQMLKSKEAQMTSMEKEMEKLKDELNGYQMSYQNQKDVIGRLQRTICNQRDENEMLRSQIMRLCRMTENLKDTARHEKRNVQRSRSHGSEIREPVKGQCQRKNIPYMSSEEESTTKPPCCHCCGLPTSPPNKSVPNRPRSESGKREQHRCGEAFPRHCCSKRMNQ